MLYRRADQRPGALQFVGSSIQLKRTLLAAIFCRVLVGIVFVHPLERSCTVLQRQQESPYLSDELVDRWECCTEGLVPRCWSLVVEGTLPFKNHSQILNWGAPQVDWYAVAIRIRTRPNWRLIDLWRPNQQVFVD